MFASSSRCALPSGLLSVRARAPAFLGSGIDTYATVQLSYTLAINFVHPSQLICVIPAILIATTCSSLPWTCPRCITFSLFPFAPFLSLGTHLSYPVDCRFPPPLHKPCTFPKIGPCSLLFHTPFAFHLCHHASSPFLPMFCLFNHPALPFAPPPCRSRQLPGCNASAHNKAILRP
jgi:hypothetical protein